MPTSEGHIMQGSRGFLEALKKNWILVVVVTVLSVLGAIAVLRVTVPVFSASSSLYFSLSSGDSAGDLNQGSTYTQSLMVSFAELANKPVVLEMVIDELDLDVTARQLSGQVSAASTTDSVLLDVTVQDENPKAAAAIANSVANHLGEVVQGYSPRDESDAATIVARLVDPADTPTTPVSPNARLTLIAGLLIGLSVGIMLALLRDRIDTRLRTENDLRLITTAPILGAIQFDPNSTDSNPLFHRDSRSPLAEAYRRVRANLQFIAVDDGSLSLVITSSTQSDGKTTLISNLALALAETDARTILVDGDLRRPSVAAMTGIEGSVGLTTVLSGQATLQDVVQPWGETQLDILPAGSIPPNPSELLSSSAMVKLMSQLREEYEIILIDTPPVLAVTDATILARLTSGALVVVDRRQSRAPQLRKSLDALGQAGVTLLGVVFNRVPKGSASPAYSYGAEAAVSVPGRLQTVSDETSDRTVPVRQTQKRIYQLTSGPEDKLRPSINPDVAGKKVNGNTINR